MQKSLWTNSQSEIIMGSNGLSRDIDEVLPENGLRYHEN